MANGKTNSRANKVARYAALGLGIAGTFASYYNLFVIQQGTPDPLGGTFDIATAAVGMIGFQLSGGRAKSYGTATAAIPAAYVIGRWGQAVFLPTPH